MQLDLNPEQAAELRGVLDITLRDLSYEIASADLPTFRQNLRHSRELLRGILRTLDEANQGAQPAGHSSSDRVINRDVAIEVHDRRDARRSGPPSRARMRTGVPTPPAGCRDIRASGVTKNATPADVSTKVGKKLLGRGRIGP